MNDTITIAHHLTRFCVTEEPKRVATRNGLITVTEGRMETEIPRFCYDCGGIMHIHQKHRIQLQHIPLMGRPHILNVEYVRTKC